MESKSPKFARAVIHAGYGKCGSTALQLAFSLNNSVLAKNGVLYPVVGAVRTSLPQGASFEHNNLLGIALPYDQVFEQIRRIFRSNENLESNNKLFFDDVIRRKRDSPSLETLLVSAEYLVDLSRDALLAFKEKIHEVAEGIKVVIYLRMPASAYKAHISQSCKVHGEFESPYRFNLMYRDTIQKMYAVFGECNVDVLPFNLNEEGFDVVSDFAGRYFPFKMESDTVNQSLSLTGLFFISDYRETVDILIEDRRKSDLLISWVEVNDLKYSSATRFKLKKEIEEIVVSNHLEDIFWLEKNCVNFYHLSPIFEAIKKRPAMSVLEDGQNITHLKTRDLVNFVEAVPDQKEMYSYNLWVIKGLLEACVVMNERLNSGNLAGDQ